MPGFWGTKYNLEGRQGYVMELPQGACQKFSLVNILVEVFLSKWINIQNKSCMIFFECRKESRVKKFLFEFFRMSKKFSSNQFINGNFSNVEKIPPFVAWLAGLRIFSNGHWEKIIFSNMIWKFFNINFCCRNFSLAIFMVEKIPSGNVVKILSRSNSPVEKNLSLKSVLPYFRECAN